MISAFHIGLLALVTMSFLGSLEALGHVVKDGDTLSTLRYEIAPFERPVPRRIGNQSAVKPAPKREVAQEPVVKVEEVVPPISSPVATETPLPEFQRFSFLKIEPHLSYARLDGVDPRDGSKATLISNTNVGATATWTQVWSSSWKSFQTLGLSRDEIRPDTSSQLPIANAVQVRPRVGVGAIYSLSPSLDIGGMFLYQQEIYYHGQVGVLGIILDGIMVPQAHFWFSYEIVQLKPFDLRAEGRLSTLLPASSSLYTTQWGLGYRGKLEVGQTFDGTRVSAGFFYHFQNQSTSILNLNRQEMGLELGVSWRLGN